MLGEEELLIVLVILKELLCAKSLKRVMEKIMPIVQLKLMLWQLA
jgi:hypothetical protein